MKTLVMKFGGTSVGSAEAIAQSAEIVKAAKNDWLAVAVIVSAMSGVTDLLLKGAHTAAAGDGQTFRAIARDLRAKHEAAFHGLVGAIRVGAVHESPLQDRILPCLAEFESLCHAVNILGEGSPRALDAISSLGERMSIHLMAARLQVLGLTAEAVEAGELILTDDVFGSANPQMNETKARCESRLREKMHRGEVPVITGFIGATASGAVTTLGRGEISELAYYGAKVLHPKTIRPVVERGIDLWIKNTFNPAHPGTLIVPDNGHTQGAIKAVTAIQSQSLITIEGRGMLGVPGVAARTFGAVARAGVSVPLISQASSEQSICFSVPSPSHAKVVAVLQEEFRPELARTDIDSVSSMDNTVIVTVVGAGMRSTPGIAGRIFSALGNRNVNVIAIAQGSSECSISLVVDAAQADEAVKAIHQLIVNEQ
ncbi:MAG: ACT domain-containing protein [Chloroflexi bacterium]|nr:ACT domain-containing protein [Chloroflexota bacterium]